MSQLEASEVYKQRQKFYSSFNKIDGQIAKWHSTAEPSHNLSNCKIIINILQSKPMTLSIKSTKKRRVCKLIIVIKEFNLFPLEMVSRVMRDNKNNQIRPWSSNNNNSNP